MSPGGRTPVQRDLSTFHRNPSHRPTRQTSKLQAAPASASTSAPTTRPGPWCSTRSYSSTAATSAARAAMTASGIAVDGAGNAYVTGSTASDQTTFPVTGGPDLTYNGNARCLRGQGQPGRHRPASTPATSAARATMIGNGIAVDGAGNAYVTGDTASNQATFPVIGGPDLTYNGGVSMPSWPRSTPTGTALVYAGYIGGAGTDTELRHRGGRRRQRLCHGRDRLRPGHLPCARWAGPDLQRRRLAMPSWPRSTRPAPGLVYAGYIGGAGGELGLRHRGGRRRATPTSRAATESDRGHLPRDSAART